LNNKSVIVENLSKEYQLGTTGLSSFRDSFSNIFSKKESKINSFLALKDISFTIEQGEAVGIIGRNGAGKSTLLKILSRITYPTKGKFQLNGRVSSLLEVGTGFHPELTGRENIYLNGTILGMTRAEVKSKFDEIVAFSGVEQFIDTPVKRYSSGMYVRLAFAVAAHLEPEILIVDEVLAVGDAEFQKKCLGKMKDVSSNQGRTVLFVSHSMTSVKNLCSKSILLNKGNIDSIGSTDDVIDKYLINEKKSSLYKPNVSVEKKDIFFTKIEITNSLHNSSSFKCSEAIRIEMEMEISTINNPYNLFVIIKTQRGIPVFSAEKKILKTIEILEIEPRFLTRGDYMIHTFIHIPNAYQLDIAENICHFSITDTDSDLSVHGEYDYGSVFGRFKWL
jgi:lipopolysaccharide transport system ATP-binding protein